MIERLVGEVTPGLEKEKIGYFGTVEGENFIHFIREGEFSWVSGSALGFYSNLDFSPPQVF